jgi:hypothetical protein
LKNNNLSGRFNIPFNPLKKKHKKKSFRKSLGEAIKTKDQKNNKNSNEIKIIKGKKKKINKIGKKRNSVNFKNKNPKNLDNIKIFKRFASINNSKNSKDIFMSKSRKMSMINNSSNFNIVKNNNNITKLRNFNNESYKSFNFFKNEKIDVKQYFIPIFEGNDYDDVVEEDKRTFCEYYGEKIKNNQIIINNLFIFELLKPRPIKIIVSLLDIILSFLINGLFYSDSYISEIFNSTEEETFFSFVPRSIDRFFYCTMVGTIIGYIVDFFFVEEIKLRKILLRKEEDSLLLKNDLYQILKSVVKKIKIFTIFNYIVVIITWYYISCFNNVYPNIKNEWIKSSFFIIIIIQILPFISSLLETCIRYISIKCESEKLFKVSLLLS